MGLLSGLEKFGLGQLETADLFQDDKKSRAEEILAQKQKAKEEREREEKKVHKETEYLLSKTMRCPVCDNIFRTQMVKTGRMKRLEPDFDLRPRFENIDTNKYDVCACPHCGYTSMHRYFPALSPGQIKLLKENVMSKFTADGPVSMEPVVTESTYEEAIDAYKLSLYCTVVKKGAVSERAYTCLKIAWLYRGLTEKLLAEGENESEALEQAKQGESSYYEQAYEGLQKAASSEMFPLCGMDEDTFNILLAGMAFKLNKIDIASRLVSAVLLSKKAGAAAKNRAYNLKEDIIAKIKKQSS